MRHSTREHKQFISRYEFDAGECSKGNGYAQVDTTQDAPYFGIWANPYTFTTVCYCEGDIHRTVCDTMEEFIDEMEEMKVWYGEEKKWIGVDAYDNKERWHEIGLTHLLTDQ